MEWVILSATGRLARVDVPGTVWTAQSPARADHDVIAAAAPVVDGYVGVVTTAGTAYRLSAGELPDLIPGGPWSLWDAPRPESVLPLPASASVVGLYSLDLDAPPLAIGTRNGVVKRVVPEYKGWESWPVMAVKDEDAIVGLAHAADQDDLVFITADAQLLRLPAREVRPQGRSSGGMAGIKLAEDSQVLCFSAVSRTDAAQAVVATLAVGPDAAASAKLTPFTEYPAKGRATAGVRTHRFLKGQDRLALAWVGLPPVRACDAAGVPRNLPSAEDRRDGTGAKVYGPFFAFG